MSILIRGMEMPTSCEDCPLENCDENYYGDESNHRCSLIYKGYTSDNRYEKRRNDCPLVPIPPHGRLIDADALEYHADNVRDTMGRTEKTVMWNKIQSAPTIIEAEVGK